MLQHGLIHIANLVYLASYAVKDIRVLRWLTIVGIVLLIPYYLAWHLWEPAIWNGIFLGINLLRLRSHSRTPTATVTTQHQHEKGHRTNRHLAGSSLLCSQGRASL
jgi:hypothetical protein